MKKSSIYQMVTLLMVFALGLSGCTDSLRGGKSELPSYVTSSQSSDDGEWIPYTIEFNATDMITPSLRSLTEEQENDIKSGSVRVLVFDTTTSQSLFVYEAPVSSVTSAQDKKSGQVQLLLKHTDAAQYRFVMLANLQADTPKASEFAGKTYDEVMKQFTYTMPSDGEWKGGDLPMWGEVKAVVNSGVNTPNATIKLIRAVARIDVGLNLTSDGEGASQFNEKANGLDGITMTSIKFYNMNNAGSVAPASDNLEENPTKVKAPTIPDGVDALSSELNMTTEIADGKLLQRSVYVPEAENYPATLSGDQTHSGADENYMNRPYMVVGLKGADKSKPERKTYYRIDFLKKDSSDASEKYEYLSLLRNYRYIINITNVGGPGFDSEDEAKKGTVANITYNVETWNESQMSGVQYDGQYILAVSEDNLTYYNHAYTKNITVRTSWPKGWTATVTKGGDWIHIQPNAGDANKDVTMGISVKANEKDDAVEREGVVTIKAGRMTWDVKVKQLPVGEVALEIYEYDADGMTLKPEPISMLSFTGKGGTKKIAVKYSPSNALDIPEVSPGAEGYSGPIDLTLKDIQFEKVNDESKKGMAVYNVTANPMGADNEDYFESITEVANFTIKSEGKTVSKALVLQQTEYNAIPYETIDLNKVIQFVENPLGTDPITHEGSIPFFLMDGEDGDNFVIKANTRYDIKMISTSNEPQVKTDDNEGLKLIEGGFPLNDEEVHKRGKFAGEMLAFTTANDLQDPKRFLGYVEFEITSPDKLFEPRTFKLLLASGIMQKEANTYLMKPGYIGIIIPVSQIDKAADYYNGFETSFQTYMSQKSKNLGGRTWDANFKLPKLDKNKSWTVEVLWAEVMNTYPDNEPVVSGNDPNKGVLYILTEAGKDYIFVMPSYNYTGNVIIGLRQEGKIMWSWHLWLVKSYPSDDPVLPPSEVGIPWPDRNGIKWLDRDLGAFGITTGDRFNNFLYEQHGLLYQWGRKDPFPLLKVKNKSVLEGTGRGRRNTKLIDAEGNDYYNDFINASKHVKTVGTMKEMINNPTVYYSTTENTNYVDYEDISPFLELPNGPKDKFFPNDAYAALWGGVALSRDKIKFEAAISATNKTPFDPSPYGWKVPNSGAEANWGKYRPGLSTVDGTSDFYKQHAGPHFPKMSDGDSESFRWTSTRISDNVRARYIWGSGNDPKPAINETWSTSAGIMVRSVRNEKEKDYEKYLPDIELKK